MLHDVKATEKSIAEKSIDVKATEKSITAGGKDSVIDPETGVSSVKATNTGACVCTCVCINYTEIDPETVESSVKATNTGIYTCNT